MLYSIILTVTYLTMRQSEVTSSRNLLASSYRPSLIKAFAIVASVFEYCFLLDEASDLKRPFNSAMNFNSLDER